MKAITSLFAAMLILGCGASDSQQTTPDDEDIEFSPEDDAIFGDAPPSGALLDDPEDEDATREPEPVGPAEVTIEVKLGLEEVRSATVVVKSASGATVAEGRGGETFTLQAGTYSVTARVTSDDLIVTAPAETTESIDVEPQEPQTVRVTIPAAHVRLTVKRNGRTIRNPLVTLFREGGDEQVAQFRAGNQEITISPGRYEADVRTGSQEIRVRGLMFMGGARQNIPVNIQ